MKLRTLPFPFVPPGRSSSICPCPQRKWRSSPSLYWPLSGMESIDPKNLEPPLSTTDCLQARWTFGLSASASILISECFHYHLQIEVSCLIQQQELEFRRFFSHLGEHLGLVTHWLVNITQASALLKSKNNKKKIPETQNAWAERTCSAVVPDVQLGFLRELDLDAIISFEFVGQFQPLRSLTCQDGLISNTSNLCSVHEDQQRIKTGTQPGALSTGKDTVPHTQPCPGQAAVLGGQPSRQGLCQRARGQRGRA